MSAAWDAQKVAKITGGETAGQWRAEGVSIDSRTLRAGELFVALRGPSHDGHAYVAAALEKGAAGAVVDHVPENVRDASKLIVAEDTFQALQCLGAYGRRRSKAKCVAVTGSVGKTSTKEMLKLALSALGKTYATTGNLNNHIGVPLTLANLPADTDFAVIEMGMNHAGEITPLSQLAEPQVAIVTAVEAVHLEFFDSVKDIAAAKLEICKGLAKDGTVLLPSDHLFIKLMRAQAKAHGVKNIATFGKRARSNFRLMDYRPEGLKGRVEARIGRKTVIYTLGAVGRHFALLSVAVLGAISALSADWRTAAAALAGFHEAPGRGAIQQVPWKGGEITLIDDSYNASPASMQAGFSKLRDVHKALGSAGRTVAVLGDMLELGPQTVEFHQGLAPLLQKARIDKVCAAGPLMHHLFALLPASQQGAWTPTAEALLPALREALQPGDTVLIKGSHGSRMHTLVDPLTSQEDIAHAV